MGVDPEQTAQTPPPMPHAEAVFTDVVTGTQLPPLKQPEHTAVPPPVGASGRRARRRHGPNVRLVWGMGRSEDRRLGGPNVGWLQNELRRDRIQYMNLILYYRYVHLTAACLGPATSDASLRLSVEFRCPRSHHGMSPITAARGCGSVTLKVLESSALEQRAEASANTGAS